VREPHDPTRVTGGSSSGCAALVASKAVDLAIGGDQGGPIRVPAAFCGIVGHKPSWGLVLDTGAVPLDYAIDHLRPMAHTVRECARLLEAPAGPDGINPRQFAGLASQPHVRLLKKGARGLRVAVLDEGVGVSGAEADVEGMRLGRGSIPEHRAPAVNGFTALLGVSAIGLPPLVGAGSRGPYLLALHDWVRSRRSGFAAVSQPLNLPLGQLYAAEAVNRSGGHMYATAQNLARALRAAYDRALADVDLQQSRQHEPVRQLRSPGHLRAARRDRWPAGRVDAGRGLRGRRDGAARGARLRAGLTKRVPMPLESLAALRALVLAGAASGGDRRRCS